MIWISTNLQKLNNSTKLFKPLSVALSLSPSLPRSLVQWRPVGFLCWQEESGFSPPAKTHSWAEDEPPFWGCLGPLQSTRPFPIAFWTHFYSHFFFSPSLCLDHRLNCLLPVSEWTHPHLLSVHYLIAHFHLLLTSLNIKSSLRPQSFSHILFLRQPLQGIPPLIFPVTLFFSQTIITFPNWHFSCFSFFNSISHISPLPIPQLIPVFYVISPSFFLHWYPAFFISHLLFSFFVLS